MLKKEAPHEEAHEEVTEDREVHGTAPVPAADDDADPSCVAGRSEGTAAGAAIAGGITHPFSEI